MIVFAVCLVVAAVLLVLLAIGLVAVDEAERERAQAERRDAHEAWVDQIVRERRN